MTASAVQVVVWCRQLAYLLGVLCCLPLPHAIVGATIGHATPSSYKPLTNQEALLREKLNTQFERTKEGTNSMGQAELLERMRLNQKHSIDKIDTWHNKKHPEGWDLKEWHHFSDALQVNDCAASSPALGDHEGVVVFTHNLAEFGHSSIMHLEHSFERAAELQVLGIDTALIVPMGGSVRWQHQTQIDKNQTIQTVRALTEAELFVCKKHNVHVHQVPWTTPPGLSSKAEMCANSQLIKLHVLNLTKWKAALYIDSDVTIIKKEGVKNILQCAASGRFLTAKGSTGAPVNFGMFATATSEQALLAFMWYSRHALWTKEGLQQYKGGWDNAGAWPTKGGFAGYGCDQGIVWTFFYGNGLSIAAETFKARGGHLAYAARAVHKFHLIPHIIDRCRYNYQRENAHSDRRSCTEDFTCADVVLVHKHHKLNATMGTRKTKDIQSFGDRLRRKGVCGCSKRYWTEKMQDPTTKQWISGGWKNDTCSGANFHEMFPPEEP